jgi:two-component system, NarL family, sensor histidine kinase LiaS
MPNPFISLRRLRWKLTLSYTLVTALAVLFLEMLLLAALFAFLVYSPFVTKIVEQEAISLGEAMGPFLACGEPSEANLQAWLQHVMPNRARGSAFVNFESGLAADEEVQLTGLLDGDIAVVGNPKGLMLSSSAPGVLPVYETEQAFFDPMAPAESQRIIALALGGQPASSFISQENLSIAAAPVYGPNQEILGYIYLRFSSFSPSDTGSMLFETLPLLGVSALLFFLGAGAIGTFFGFITAQGLARRFQTVSTAAMAWSRGDFSAFIQDSSGDELSELSQQLNRMAEQLQNLLHARQELAALEERNRLARDLHDSVKQQVFASAMQLGAARALLDRDPQGVRGHLEEAERLSRQAQQELTSLIKELRPAALSGKGLAAALRDYLRDWSSRTQIEANIHVQGERALPLPIEQALFRVVQEALANTARHSQATSLALHLTIEKDQLNMIIADNGQGFDLQQAAGKGIGLASMRERIENLGGQLSVESGPDGTRLSGFVPLLLQPPLSGDPIV